MSRKRNSRDLDKIDRLILVELQKDARISNIELSRRVNLSPTPCLLRVRRLEKDGYIKGYRAELDYSLLGAPLMVFVHISVNQSMLGQINELRSSIQMLPEVLECYMVSGEFDYLLKVRLESMEKFQEFLSLSLARLPHIRQTHSHFVISELTSLSEFPVEFPVSQTGIESG